jgi:hypothetical protein
MKLIYLFLFALLLTVLTSFFPNSLVKGKPEQVGLKRDNQYAPLNIEGDFGMWYIIPGTKKYSSSNLEALSESAFPCFLQFRYFGYPFATVRDVCSRKETNLITVMMSLIVYLIIVLLGSYFYRVIKQRAIQ